MATFLSLPNEIKLQIIDDTAPDGIENFALCCRLVYTLAEKTLKQHKADKVNYDDINFNFLWHGFHSRELFVYEQLLVLLESQRLRLYPRSVQMLCDSNWFRRATSTRSFKREVRHVFDRVLNNLDSPYMDNSEMKILLSKVVAEDVGAANSMLLTLLPNVKRIYLCEYIHHDSAMIDMLSKISATNEKAPSWMQEKLSLVKLEEITIHAMVPDLGTQSGTLEAFMTLPSLRVIRGHQLTGNYTFSKWLYPEQCSNVTELHFHQCTLAVTDLARLFKHLKELRVFSYDHRQVHQIPTKRYGAGALINELYTHAGKTLTYLNYTSDTRAPQSGGYPWGPQPSMLSKFSALQTLRISRATMLIPYQIPGQLIKQLPSSLEELEIVDILYGYEATLMFDGMLALKQTFLPSLRLVIFDSFIPFDDEAIAAYERVGLMLDRRPSHTNWI